MPAINEILHERYRIIRQLGQGGMGTVYEAEDLKRFGKPVALKEILLDLSHLPDPARHEIARRAFEREAKILTQVDHEAFPQVIDYFTEATNQYLVMELIKGDELGELLKNQQMSFPLEEIIKWADQLLDALDYLHTLTPPVIHRDIKPQNIKLTTRGKIKLLDFGIAKGDDLQSNSTITNQTFIAATLNYSPIEQIIRVLDVSVRGIIAYQHPEKITKIEQQIADPRSDIYAFGATLYHFLTNQPPIDSLKRSLEVWNANPDPLINPQLLNPKIPAEISDWLLKAMAVDSEDRFATAREMHRSLIRNFAESAPDQIKGQNLEEHDPNNIYNQQETSNLETEVLFNNPGIIRQEEVTSVKDNHFMNSEDFSTGLNLVSFRISENLSNDSRPELKTIVLPKRNNQLFLIIPALLLLLVILGGGLWAAFYFFNPPLAGAANRNSGTNNIVNTASPVNNENTSLIPNQIPSPINNTSDNLNRRKPRVIESSPKIVSPKHPPPGQPLNTNCIFNDNCR